MKKLLLMICMFLSANLSVNTFAENSDLVNIAYVEVNSNALSNVGCYLRSDTLTPFFQMVSIFAANINGTAPNKPVIYFNPQVDALLNHSTQVADLQHKGIKVLLSMLGNHQNAGWSCMTDKTAIQLFANSIVDMMNKYHLDGIDIDDEYSNCIPNATSMIKIARAIKSNPNFNGKILTKALYNDSSYFQASDAGNKLADFLNYGWEMTYGSANFNARLSPYVGYGMTKSKLVLGVDNSESYPSPDSAASFVLQNGYQGVMTFGVTKNSQDYLSKLSNIEYGVNINVLPTCLKTDKP